MVKEELTYKDTQLKNIVILLGVIVFLQVIFNWDKVLEFISWFNSI